jgi:hypothetical protein
VALAQAALVQADQVATEVQAVPVALEIPVNHPDPAARARAAIAVVRVTTSGTALAGIL